ncbi:tetratricopeptide repeat protein [Pseudoxanthomonas sp. NC8]|nr:tetratricopeptide repeat protein [Pseudoxanthomonas sp. NC8]
MNDFRQALQASPGNARVHADLGYQQFRLGHYRDAIASYRTAVALRPDDGDYWSIFGGLLLAVGDNDAAEAALQRSLAIEPNEAALANPGHAALPEARLRRCRRFLPSRRRAQSHGFLLPGQPGRRAGCRAGPGHTDAAGVRAGRRP